MPQQAAGIRMEPPVSLPYATSASSVATATAEPLDEPPGTRVGIERVHRSPVPLVHAGHAEGQLVQVRAPDDPGPRLPGAGQARGVPVRRYRPLRHGAATRRRRFPRHVDEVLDGQADSGTRRLVAGDEGGHPLIVSSTWSTVAPGGNWNSDGAGDDEKLVIWKLVESDATLT